MMTALEQQETIVAQATAIGKGGVGIIRVSGADATAIAIAILGHCPAPRHAYYGNFHDNDGTVLDQGIALYFPNQYSLHIPAYLSSLILTVFSFLSSSFL